MNKIMSWNWRGIRAVIRKDLLVVFKNRMVVAPMLILPIIFTLLLPLLVGVLYLNAPADNKEFADAIGDFESLIRNIPLNDATFASLDDLKAQSLYLIYLYLFVPFFLMLPVMTGSIVAADSFAGEKERKTLEALLHTPLSDFELYLAKWLSPLITAMIMTLFSAVMYGIVVNGVMLSGFGRAIFPNWAWVVLLIWVVPAIACMGLGVTVWASSRVSTFQEAYQAGAFVILPIVLLFISQAAGVIYFDVVVSLILGAVIWAIDLFLYSLGARKFSRGAILSRLT
ncbi:MAG: ABC transporter permease subunit [Anaerolineae bacterium]|nr:ABC transporter permease subunit [Anaerolineae bacterium]